MLVLGCAAAIQAQVPAQGLLPSQPALGQPPGVPGFPPGDPNAPPLLPEDDLRMADPTATHGRFPVVVAGGRVVVNAHLYGAIGGAVIAGVLLVRKKKKPASQPAIDD